MDALDLLWDLHDRGIVLTPNGGKLTVEPANLLTDDDREAIRQNKPALLQILSQMPEAFTVVLDLEAIVAAIVKLTGRSPFEGTISIDVVARSAVACTQVVRELTGTARAEALAMCAEASREAVRLAEARNVEGMGELLKALPARLRAWRLN